MGFGASALGSGLTPSPAHELGAPPPRQGTPPPVAAVDVLTDPFRSAASAPFANGASHTPPVVAPFGAVAPTRAPEASLSDARELAPRRGMHPMAYAFIAASVAFGGVAAFVLLTKPPPPPQIVVVQGGGTPGPTGAPAAPDATVETHVGEVETNPGGKPVAGGPRPGAAGGTTAAPGPPAAPLDTAGVGTPGGPAPGPGPGSQGSTAGQGQLSAGEIQGVVSQNQALVKRKCWQPALDARTGTGPASTKVTANLVIGPSGNVDSVSAGGGEKDFPGLSSCVAGRIKGWKFPPSGGSTPVSVPFVFAGQ
ncbi:MAG: AgmX/PglI C-terminal domain-containing protein [Polyangiaceae bacterium]